MEEDEITIGHNDWKERLAYKHSLAGHWQRKRIGLMRRGFKWWITIGLLAGVFIGMLAGGLAWYVLR